MINQNHQHHYVSAIDGARRFLVAGPYSSHEAALLHVDQVRRIACDHSRNASAGRAAFMAWGTASSEEPQTTALGAVYARGEITPSSVRRIERLYEVWVGYNPIRECGLSAREALQTLREFRAEGGAA